MSRTIATTHIGVLVCVAAMTSGCMTAHIEQSRNTLTGVGEGEAVVILARSYHNGNYTEKDFIDCVDGRG